MHEVFNIYSNCQGCCGVLDLNCSSSLGPVDEEMQQLLFTCGNIDMGMPVSLSQNRYPRRSLDKEAPDPQKL